MIHLFKAAGQRFVLDAASGTVTAVDEIAYKMLAYLTPPLPAACPSAIRYDMAKYDSQLVERTYQGLLLHYQNGRIFSDTQTEGEPAPIRTVVCTSRDSAVVFAQAEEFFSFILTDTDDPAGAVRLCRAAEAAGAACITVRMTAEAPAGSCYPCSRLLTSEADYPAHASDAPAVGVWFACSPTAPQVLEHVIRLADSGITLLDMVPDLSSAASASEVSALCKSINKTAKELYLRAKEGRPVTFLPFEAEARHSGARALCGDCKTCTHRAVCAPNTILSSCAAPNPAVCAVNMACIDAQLALKTLL